MFDVGFAELVLLFVIGLLILGPERLPRVASQVGRWVGRARRTANQLRHQLEREIALNDIRNPPAKKSEPPKDSGTAKQDQSANPPSAGPSPSSDDQAPTDTSPNTSDQSSASTAHADTSDTAADDAPATDKGTPGQ